MSFKVSNVFFKELLEIWAEVNFAQQLASLEHFQVIIIKRRSKQSPCQKYFKYTRSHDCGTENAVGVALVNQKSYSSLPTPIEQLTEVKLQIDKFGFMPDRTVSQYSTSQLVSKNEKRFSDQMIIPVYLMISQLPWKKLAMQVTEGTSIRKNAKQFLPIPTNVRQGHLSTHWPLMSFSSQGSFGKWETSSITWQTHIVNCFSPSKLITTWLKSTTEFAGQ